jgi:hypothetical protein
MTAIDGWGVGMLMGAALVIVCFMALTPDPGWHGPRHVQQGDMHTVTATSTGEDEACEPEMLRICPGGYRVLHHRAHWECVFRCEEVNP